MGTLLNRVNAGYNAPCANRVYLVEEERKEIIAKTMILRPRPAYTIKPKGEPLRVSIKNDLL
jgi:hypothetical protein